MEVRNIKAKITGVGSFVPPASLTNNEVIKKGNLKTTDEWVREHAGVKERRILNENKGNVSMAVGAARKALEESGKGPRDIDLIIVGTETAEYRLPAIASFVRESLKARKEIPAFDHNAACASFCTALGNAALLLHNGNTKTALVIGSDTMFRIQNPKNRDTAILFGDGAGAVVLEKSDFNDCLEISLLGGYSVKDVYAPQGGYFEMDRKRTKSAAIKLLTRKMKEIGNRFDFYIFHQASLAVLKAVLENSGISRQQTHLTLDKYGNTGSASIPLTLDDALNAGKIKRGDTVVLSAVGVGWQYAHLIMKWVYNRNNK